MNDRFLTRKILRGGVLTGLAAAAVFGVTACKSKDSSAPIVSVADGAPAGDPADQNLAAPYTGGSAGGYGSAPAPAGNTRVLGSSQSYGGQQSGESYGNPNSSPQQPNDAGAPSPGQYDPNGQGYYDPNAQGYDNSEAGEQAVEEANQAPPPLPEYDQPPAPEQNDLWTPGYWNYQNTGYYWVPGAWCAPPFYGALWTPPWWGFGAGHYLFHRGYWGPHVGYYGGINYGFGYIGTGYYGGYWRNRDFVYNRAVSNVNINDIHNVYDRQVVFNGRQYGPHPEDRVSYNGGRGGITAQPRPFELAASHEPHYAPLAQQRDLRVAAASNRSQSFAANGGRPAQAFAGRPVGSLTAIASTPHEQPFNHPGPVRPSIRPGDTQPGPNAAARPGLNAGAQPGFNGAREGTPAQANSNHAQPGNGGQLGNHAQPGNSGQFGNRGQLGNSGQPENRGPRNGTVVVPPATQGRVVTPGQPPENQHPTANGQESGLNGGRPGSPSEVYNHHQSPQGSRQQPGTEAQRPSAPQENRAAPQVQQQPRPQQEPPQQSRPQQPPQQSRPQQQQSQQQGRPQFQQARPAPEARPAPAPRAAPAPTPHAAPAPQTRPAPAPRAAPAPEARPAPTPRAAPAPHEEGERPH